MFTGSPKINNPNNFTTSKRYETGKNKTPKKNPAQEVREKSWKNSFIRLRKSTHPHPLYLHLLIITILISVFSPPPSSAETEENRSCTQVLIPNPIDPTQAQEGLGEGENKTTGNPEIAELSAAIEDQVPKTGPQRFLTLGNLLARYQERIQRGFYPTSPDFKDPSTDQALSTRWGGISGPRLFSDSLPKGVKFISHPLFKADEPGVVKTGGDGGFISLRAQVQLSTGKIIETNVGAPSRALSDNLDRSEEQKSLVVHDPKAVLLYLHGGGTRSTGHHVGQNFFHALSDYGISTVSLDLPFHGEGPRDLTSIEEFFDYLRSFLKQYISIAGKPIFLCGHSMGGQIADVYMRRYPKDDLVSGLIILSSVVDLNPQEIGETQEVEPKVSESPEEILERARQERTSQRQNIETNFSAVAKEMDFLRTDNVSSIAHLFAEGLAQAHRWTLPPHRGANFLPALMVWGTNDYLFKGREEIVEKYIRPLSNVELKLYGDRTNFRGNTLPTGHFIFNHYIPKTDPRYNPKMDQFEVYRDSLDFISRILGQELKKRTKTTEEASRELYTRLVATFANNLLFRDWILTAGYSLEKTTQKFNDLMMLSNKIEAYFKHLNTAARQTLASRQRKAPKLTQATQDQKPTDQNTKGTGTIDFLLEDPEFLSKTAPHLEIFTSVPRDFLGDMRFLQDLKPGGENGYWGEKAYGLTPTQLYQKLVLWRESIHKIKVGQYFPDLEQQPEKIGSPHISL